MTYAADGHESFVSSIVPFFIFYFLAFPLFKVMVYGVDGYMSHPRGTDLF